MQSQDVDIEIPAELSIEVHQLLGELVTRSAGPRAIDRMVETVLVVGGVWTVVGSTKAAPDVDGP